MNERLFLFEVVMPSQREAVQSPSQYRQSHLILKVSYSRMKQEIQRLTRLGGQILKITPFHPRSSSPVQWLNLPWWIEIETSQPRCLYYFGPFDEVDEAHSYESGYIDDLKSEGAQGIKVEIKQCQPSVLTQEG